MDVKMTRKSAVFCGKCSPPSASTDISHVSLDHEKLLHEQYEFSDKLGEGSFGVVYRVTHRPSGQQYACKTINKDKVSGSRIIKLIDREVKILKDVSHEHIIELKQVFETAQKIYLIMELCEGGELSKLLAEHGPFSEQETRATMQQLAGAISYLHKHGKVHRDLKLENILLSRRPDSIDQLCIKVTDFGLSIEKGGVGTDNMLDDYCGTPMYMAPEIVDNRSYSEKCDIWALGVIMFLLLTGGDDQRVSELTKCSDIKEKLSDRHWKFLSDKVKDCLVGVMRSDPAHRLTADEFLDHPWISGQQLDMSKKNVLEMMKEFGRNPGKEDEDVVDDMLLTSHSTESNNNVNKTSVTNKSSSIKSSQQTSSSRLSSNGRSSIAAVTMATVGTTTVRSPTLHYSASACTLTSPCSSSSSARLSTDPNSARLVPDVRRTTTSRQTAPVSKVGSATRVSGVVGNTTSRRSTLVTHGRQKST